jgi:transposase
MKEKKSPGATRQHRDQAFKLEAVRLWQSSGRPAAALAGELGIKAHDLYRWKRAGQSPRAAGATGLPVGTTALTHEVMRLRREVARLTEQRDILKKAAGILCEPPPRGMPGSRP